METLNPKVQLSRILLRMKDNPNSAVCAGKGFLQGLGFGGALLE